MLLSREGALKSWIFFGAFGMFDWLSMLLAPGSPLPSWNGQKKDRSGHSASPDNDQTSPSLCEAEEQSRTGHACSYREQVWDVSLRTGLGTGHLAIETRGLLQLQS